MRSAAALIALFSPAAAAPALAGETPRYEAAPAWVVEAPPFKAAAPTAPALALVDQQTRISDGTVWSYRELGTRAISAEVLARMGTLTLNWQPFHGDLIVHRVDIVRDGRRIDVLKDGQSFKVIRREQGLERLERNGVLTATMQVEGLQLGDVLDVAYSVSSHDAALKGAVQAGETAILEPAKIDMARARLLWPASLPVRWKALPQGLAATEHVAGGWREVDFTLPGPKPPDMPADAPRRFKPPPLIEASSFPDWAAVSEVFAPLYDTQGLIKPGSPLAQEVAGIRARGSDPKRRAAAALQLVQDRIRYFADGMNGGNYMPQPPERTWSAAFGDCKAKTLLLLAMLHALDIDAEPMLANIGLGDLVSSRLSAPAAFNHILVHAKVAGEDLWLDGTARGTRLEDLADPPPFKTVLPVRGSGAGLLSLPSKAPARPNRVITLDVDQSAGIGLPGAFSAKVQVRGAAADALHAVSAQLDNEKLLALAFASLGGAAGPDAVPVTQAFAFDPAQGTATITLTGITRPAWRRQDHVYRLRPVTGLAGLAITSDRSRAVWANIPVATGDPGHTRVSTTLQLPDGGRALSLEGDPALDLTVGSRRYLRRSELKADRLTIEESATSTGAEMVASELPQARAAFASAQGRSLRLETSRDYPAPQLQAAGALKAGNLDKLTALYSAFIAVKPDDPRRYLARAAFFEASFQRELALADLSKAISLDGDVGSYLARGQLLEALGRPDKALADYKAASGIDPASRLALLRAGLLEVDRGRKGAAVAALDQHLATADDDKPDWLMAKADVLARSGDGLAALAAVSQAIDLKPGAAALFNQRCWIKGTLGVQLESALQDCTRAVELADTGGAELDSRAMTFFRLDKLDQALADLNAALDRNPASAGSLYLRAAIERRLGKAADADKDAAAARLISPRIDDEYGRWKIRA